MNCLWDYVVLDIALTIHPNHHIRRLFMRKITIVVVAVLGFALLTGVAQAEQLYPKEKLTSQSKEKAGGDGLGVLSGEFAFTRTQAPADYIIKEIG